MFDWRWIRLITCAFAFIFIVGFTNIYEDPGNIFHNDEKLVAESIMKDNETYIRSGNVNERVLREYMVKNMPKKISAVAIGTSTAFCIYQNLVGEGSYYNLAMSGSNFYDIMALFGLLEINNIDYDKVILTVETYFFAESLYSMRNPEIKVYADYMIDYLNKKSPIAPDEVPTNYRKLVEQALSVTYFQSSVDFIRSNNSYLLPQKRWGIVDSSTYDLAHYEPDGSMVYAVGYRSRTLDDVISDAHDYDIQYRFSKGNHIGDYSMEMFRKLIEYLKERDVEVIFYICPLAPALWDRIQNDREADQYFILDEMEAFAHDVAAEYGMRVTGSFNPYNVGIKNEDFYDSRHVRYERLDAFFDFS